MAIMAPVAAFTATATYNILVCADVGAPVLHASGARAGATFLIRAVDKAGRTGLVARLASLVSIGLHRQHSGRQLLPLQFHAHPVEI